MIDRKGTGHLPKSSKYENDLSFYWQHYGLNQDPFPAVVDPAVYFPVPEWEHHLELLQHLIKSENALLAVIGAEGQGKSTFAMQVSELFNESFQVHQFEADSLFSTRKLVRELEAGFNLKAPLNESPEDQLDLQIAEVQHKENICLLLIDDAHFLPLETLNSLIFLLKQQSKNQMRLHIILFGDKNLHNKLANLAKHEVNSAIHSIELAPLTLEETEQYLFYRLNKAGLKHELPFSQMEIEKIYADSNGTQDKINYAAQQILLNNLTKQKNLVTHSMFKRHQTKIIGGCLLVIVLIAASYVLDRQGQISTPATHQQPVISFADQSQTVAPPVQTAQQSVQQPAQQTTVQTAAVITDNQQTINNANNNPNAGANNAATPPANNAIINNNPQPVAAAPAPAPIQNNTANNSPNINENNAAAINNGPAATANNNMAPAATPTAAQQTYTAEPITQPAAAVKTTVKTSELPAVAPESKALLEKNKAALKATELSKIKSDHKAIELHKRAAKAAAEKTTASSNILKQNSHYYTLQVLGLSNEKAMLKFMQQNRLQKDMHYVKTTLKGKPWFVLVYGVYKTREQAVNATRSLPASLRKYQPWPRTLANVKSDMNKG